MEVERYEANDSRPGSIISTSPYFSGAFKLAAGLVDTVRNHRFTVGTVDDSVHIKNDNDTTGPAITLDTPAKDSIATNSSIYNVKLQCADTSGVLSVNGVMVGQTFTGTRESGKNWEFTVNGLSPNVFNTIVFTATDSSLRANKTTLTLHIKYDPTMDDMEGPTIKHISCPADSAVVNNPIIVITDSIVDPSGLDSIYWTLNNVWAGKLVAVSGKPNTYQLRDTLTSYHINRIVIHAIDSSSHHNHDSDIVILDYNLPPAINDTAVNTKRNTAKTWTLNAQTMDNDTLLWSRLSSPSSLSGTITGTLPSVTFTPATDWSGVDSFYVRVSDGYWSDTGKVKLSVVDAPVAPGIKTQPASATKNVGQPVTFSVEVNSDVNPAPSYQWKHNGTVIDKASASSYTIGSVSIADSGEYTVTIANSAGTITSSAAKLTVNYAPSITKQPVSQILYLGKSVTFSVEAKGNPSPTYHWKKNGALIPNATGPSYTISFPGILDSGMYTVSMMNSVDTLVSDTARLFAVFKSVAAGKSHTLVLKTDGRLFGFGGNNFGQLDGVTEDNLITTDVKAIAAGYNQSFIIKTDGTLWACGYNYKGQLGDGSKANQPTFVKIMADVDAVAVGTSHTLILKTDGTLYCCGDNGVGQLGAGTTTEHLLPILIMNGVKSIAAGENHSLVLKTNGDLYTCGFNSSGQLGNGTTNSDSVFKKALSGIDYIAAGGNHSLAVSTGGTLYSFGDNIDGELGDGTTTSRSTPTQIRTNVMNVACGYGHSLFLLTDGSVVSCGFNSSGQIGNGTIISQHDPVQIISGIKSIAAGTYSSFFIKDNGTLWVCGANGSGELDDTTRSDIHTPKQIQFE